MNIIKYDDGGYVNADNIDCLRFIGNGAIMFSLVSSPDYDFTVKSEYAETFLNHLQSINSSICNVQFDYTDFIKRS